MYRFGDGTPFPLRENFIETLVAAVDCCVALYQAETQLDEHEERISAARRHATDEMRRLDALNGLIENALAPLVKASPQKGTQAGQPSRKTRDSRASEQAAAKIYEAAAAIIKNSRAAVGRQRDGAEHQPLSPSVRQGALTALARFFCRHELPRTEWLAHWRAGGEGTATAELGAHSLREIDLEFRATFAGEGFWARPIPMSDLVDGPVAARIEGGRRARELRLDPMVVTEVQIGPGREGMVLREATRRGGSALHILMPRKGEAGPLVVELDKRDQARGQPFYLDEASAAAMMKAWRAIERSLPDLLAAREELTAARLGGRAVSEVDHPAQIAEAILTALAPLVREMRMRSRVPGELILKRDLGGDRREEIFVPRQALWNKMADLAPRHRQLFEAIGISNEATTEFVTRVSPGSPRSSRPRAPVGTGPEKVAALEPPELPTLESYGFERDPDMIESSRPKPSPLVPRPGEPMADEGVSEVELTNPRGTDDEVSVVSGIIDRASA